MEYKLSDNTWDNKELEAIQRVIQSGFYSMGKEVAEYEKLFAEKVGSKYAIMTNSGSSANLLAVAALCYSDRLKEGDEVIVPAVSWSTTYFPLAQYNLKLKFVDVDVDVNAVFFAKRKDEEADDEEADGEGGDGFRHPEEDGEVEEEEGAVLCVGETFTGGHDHQHQGDDQRGGKEEDFFRCLRWQGENAVGVAGFHGIS